MMEQWKAMGSQAVDAIAGKLRCDSKAYRSSRPCPSCGGAMIYLGSALSILTGKYSRTCESCGYADAHKVKMVRQI
jgi:predicted RNA-binding Zn-ribbon protein involved in translation (DUF1610 family)